VFSIKAASTDGAGVSCATLGPSMATAVCVAKLFQLAHDIIRCSRKRETFLLVVGVTVDLEADFTHPDDPIITAATIMIIRTRLLCMLHSLIDYPRLILTAASSPLFWIQISNLIDNFAII